MAFKVSGLKNVFEKLRFRDGVVWMLRLQSWTKVVGTLSENDPFGSTSEFSVCYFDISTPSSLFNVVTR